MAGTLFLICSSQLNQASAENYIIMITAELSGRCRQTPIVLGEEGQSLVTKGPVDTR